MTALATPPAVRPTLLSGQGYQRLLLVDVDWAAYELIGTALRNRANIRLTYDRGSLEVMTLSPEHERLRYMLGRLIDTMLEELNLRAGGFGSTTYKQEPERGLEPDQCYYLANFDQVRHLDRIDLTRDPVPDLVLEIDVTHSSLDRLAIYARLGVPEVWRWQDDAIRVYQLAPDGRYAEGDTSSTFVADFPVGEMVRFAGVGRAEGDVAMVRAFRGWVRQFAADRGLTT